MDTLQLIAAILTVVLPIASALGYGMKKYADGRYRQLESRLKDTDAHSAQVVSTNESIQTLTVALITMVDERRESTAATKENAATTKENTAALQTMTVSMDGMGKDQGAALTVLTGAVTGLTTILTESLPVLLKSQAEAAEMLKQVVSGQDDTDAVLAALTLIVKRLNLDNRRFAEFYLRPDEASRQGLEDIASGKPDAPAVIPAAPVPAG